MEEEQNLEVVANVYGTADSDIGFGNIPRFTTLRSSSLPDICADTSSPAALDLTKAWIERCVKEHRFWDSIVSHQLPTRILELYDPSDPQAVRVCEPKGLEDKYISLNHRWGEREVLKLTRENKPELMQKIEWHKLPKTFQDALTFTHNLGVRYLWIDSLCIIQDDEDDWQRESSNMYSLYKNSYLTIAATGGFGPHDGLFTFAGNQYSLREISVTNSAGQTMTCKMRKTLPQLDNVKKFPLLERGWVFQERILSPRFLHFGPQELLWECFETATCECTIADSEIRGKREYVFLIGRQACDRCQLPGDHCAGCEIHLWRNIVMEYSRLKLTFDDDILVALSGLVEQQKEFRRTEYVYGLWMDSLPLDLTWHVRRTIDIFKLAEQDSVLPPPRLSKRRAPTWSWASVKAPIVFQDYDDFHTSPSFTWNMGFAQFETGTQVETTPILEIHSRVCPVRLHARVSNSGLGDRYQISLSLKDRAIDLECHADYDIWTEPHNQGVDVYTVLCMEIGLVRHRDLHSSEKNSACFLILKIVKKYGEDFLCERMSFAVGDNPLSILTLRVL